jgi:hypothetical protein
VEYGVALVGAPKAPNHSSGELGVFLSSRSISSDWVVDKSELIKKPRGAHAAGASCLNAVPQHAVRSDDGNAASITDIDLLPDGLDDRVISRPHGVNGAQAAVLAGRDAPPRGALKDQDHLIMRQHSGGQLFLQPTGSSRAITPPTIGATTHDVCAIDDQDLHTDSVWLSGHTFPRERVGYTTRPGVGRSRRPTPVAAI